MILKKKNTKVSEKSPFGVMLKFKSYEEFLLEQIWNSERSQILEEEFPLLYTIEYEETNEDGTGHTQTMRYRGQQDTTFLEAENRWTFDFSFCNARIIRITKEKQQNT